MRGPDRHRNTASPSARTLSPLYIQKLPRLRTALCNNMTWWCRTRRCIVEAPPQGDTASWHDPGRTSPFDRGSPTNSTRADESHVVVGRGRVYDDVTPHKGIYRGAGGPPDVTVEFTRVA